MAAEKPSYGACLAGGVRSTIVRLRGGPATPPARRAAAAVAWAVLEARNLGGKIYGEEANQRDAVCRLAAGAQSDHTNLGFPYV